MIAATKTALASTASMPAELKDKGWKLEQRTINDDETVYIAGNDGLALFSPRYNTPEEAIVEAIILQANEDSETLSKKQAESRLAVMRAVEAEQASTASNAAPELPEQLIDQKLIRLDGGTQLRELDQATVAAYAEAKKAGAKFPAIDLFFDGKDYWPGDGFHRFFADKACGLTKTYSRIHQGTKRDAILFSLGANETHGKRRSADDKRRAVLTLLEDPEWNQWSDSAIADAAKVSQPFVSAIRREIDKPAETSPTPLREKIQRAAGSTDLERFKSKGTKKIGKDKVARDTKAIGKKPAAAPDPQVVDKRRVTETGIARNTASTQAGKKATTIEALLKGRMLAVSFTWIPGVEGVQATVNASMDRSSAVRKVIPADAVPAMPEPVIEMITQQLAAKAAPKSKARSKPTPAKKKPAAARHTARKQVLAKRRASKKR